MIKRFRFAFLLALGVFLSNAVVHAQAAITGADTVIVFGWWDGAQSTADAKGEVTFELTGTFSGVPSESLRAVDSVLVDTCFAFSSLESLDVVDDTVSNTAYDTIYFMYALQNQGNATDSFTIVAGVRDTTNTNYFSPVDFCWVSDTAGADVIVGYDNNIDSAWYGLLLPQEGIDTFFVRVVLPGPQNAADEDSLRFDVHVRGHYGTGNWDAWPDTVAGWSTVNRVVIDTVDNLWHTHSDPSGQVDTLWDYGDYQMVTNYLTMGAPLVRIRTTAMATGVLPGDTLTYTMYYDNDGAAATEDTGNLVAMFPRGTMYLDTVALNMDLGVGHGLGENINVDYFYNGTWREDMPNASMTSAEYFDTLNAFTGVRFQVPAGIGRHDTTGDAGTDAKQSLTADGTSQDDDAGFVTFKLRIR
jgi:hypothetical protein